MLRSRTSFRRPLWLALATLGLGLLIAEPPASAVDHEPTPRGVPAVRVTVPTEPAFEMTGFFPNPNPTVQAIGSTNQRTDDPASDRSARLVNATALPFDGIGYQVLAPSLERYYGTYELVELIQQAGAAFGQRHPNSVVQVGDLSRRHGGTIRDHSGKRVHSSHRNGLDADINYLRARCEGGTHLNNLSCSFELRENLELMRLLVAGGPRPGETLVDTLYVSPRFLEQTCRLVDDDPVAARRYRDVLPRMEAISGHQAHFHLRIQCPEQSRACPAARKRRRDPCGGDRT